MLLITASAVELDGDINVRHPSQLHISSLWLTPSFLSLGWRSQRPSLSLHPGMTQATRGLTRDLRDTACSFRGASPRTWANYRSASLHFTTLSHQILFLPELALPNPKPRSPVQPKHIAWDGPQLRHLDQTTGCHRLSFPRGPISFTIGDRLRGLRLHCCLSPS